MTTKVSVDDTQASRLLLDSRARAMLRRTDPFEVREAYIWATRVAKHPMFSQTPINHSRFVQFAPVAALVREETGISLGKALKRAKINERHVRRLLAADRADVDEQLAKIVRLLGKKANIADLVATSIFWGDRKIRTIAMDYFGSDDDSETASGT
jgi:hypothetical protein